MTPERARDIAEGYGNDTKGMTDAILAACAEERYAALTEAPELPCRDSPVSIHPSTILALRDKE